VIGLRGLTLGRTDAFGASGAPGGRLELLLRLIAQDELVEVDSDIERLHIKY
jgi:hypothetical protein